MADKVIQMQVRNEANTEWDTLYPETSASVVKMANNQTVEEVVTTHSADIVTDADGAHGLKIEDGTFTPVIAGSTTAGVNTYASQIGYYQKIGTQVNFHLTVGLSAKDSTMAGNLLIKGLPFVTKNQVGRLLSLAIGRVDGFTYGANKEIMAQTNPNSSDIVLVKITDGSYQASVVPADINTSARFQISGTYQV